MTRIREFILELDAWDWVDAQPEPYRSSYLVRVEGGRFVVYLPGGAL